LSKIFLVQMGELLSRALSDGLRFYATTFFYTGEKKN
jgi:hypothetical protein